MKALLELFRRFDARRIFGFIRRLGGMSRPKVKCYDLRSTRALRVEGDDKDTETHTSTHTFLSTPSGWRATSAKWGNAKAVDKFLSTPSEWRATPPPHLVVCPLPISTHALRVEGDRPAFRRPARRGYFYPRPPGGGRRWGLFCYSKLRVFLSTPSGWRAKFFFCRFTSAATA